MLMNFYNGMIDSDIWFCPFWRYKKSLQADLFITFYSLTLTGFSRHGDVLISVVDTKKIMQDLWGI